MKLDLELEFNCKKKKPNCFRIVLPAQELIEVIQNKITKT